MLIQQLVFAGVLAIVPTLGAIAVYFSFKRDRENEGRHAKHAARG